MEPVLLIDFGSTYTKVTAADTNAGEILGTASAYTTVETDVGEGLQNALLRLAEKTGPLNFSRRFACSSAAGGLKMTVSGLVPALTAGAARLASLGAGAKVTKVYAYQLTDEDIDEIAAAKPDLFLLTGGTDGGNSECILHNASMLAQCKAHFPIIIAGNRGAAKECERLLADREVFRCENVMPRLGEINTEPVQEKIRELFLRRIIHAKGLSQTAELIDGILMPTPAAVLAAMVLLQKGTPAQPGLGELLAVDLGGATTDCYSIASGMPGGDGVILKGLPEPFAKRTVEGDIGMRYGARGVLEAVGMPYLTKLSGLCEQEVECFIADLEQNPGTLPNTPGQEALDYALACGAVKTAVARHAGEIEEVYTPMGKAYAQTGKDLTRVEKLIVTGGAIIHNRRVADIAACALYNSAEPQSLRPKSMDVYVDNRYILSAMGLLGEQFPDSALTIMKKELRKWSL